MGYVSTDKIEVLIEALEFYKKNGAQVESGEIDSPLILVDDSQGVPTYAPGNEVYIRIKLLT